VWQMADLRYSAMRPFATRCTASDYFTSLQLLCGNTNTKLPHNN
jgi:hypothetical protein